MGNFSRITQLRLGRDEFELLNDSGAHALSSAPDCLETGHALETVAFWTALSAGVLASQGFMVLLQSQDEPTLNLLHPEQTASDPKGCLPQWKLECLQYIYMLSIYLGATQHCLRSENDGEELQFQKSQASFHRELCSFVLVLDAAERCSLSAGCSSSSPVWWGPTPA